MHEFTNRKSLFFYKNELKKKNLFCESGFFIILKENLFTANLFRNEFCCNFYF